MIKKVLSISAVAAVILFSGCDNDAEERMNAQVMLDSGNYLGVISTLEGKEKKTDEDNLQLASAYMGKAGFNVTDLVGIISEESEASFASFTAGINENKGKSALDDLNKAIGYYRSISTIAEQNLAPSLNIEIDGETESTELFLGLAYITKVATVLSYMGDVSKLEEAGEDGNLLASGCAMAKVYSTDMMPEECASVNYSGPIVIEDITYEKVDVILNNGDGITYRRLANSSKNELVLTDYICPESDYCPVKDDKLTVLDALINTLNDGFNVIVEAAPDDIKEDIVTYRDEIDRSPQDNTISVEEFITYVNNEMK